MLKRPTPAQTAADLAMRLRRGDPGTPERAKRLVEKISDAEALRSIAVAALEKGTGKKRGRPRKKLPTITCERDGSITEVTDLDTMIECNSDQHTWDAIKALGRENAAREAGDELIAKKVPKRTAFERVGPKYGQSPGTAKTAHYSTPRKKVSKK